MLKISNVTYSYKRNIRFCGMSVSLCPTDRFLIGENGSGKSTLLKVLTSILPAEGSVSINGIDSRSDGYKSMIAYLPQEFDIYPDLKVADILRLSPCSKRG